MTFATIVPSLSVVWAISIAAFGGVLVALGLWMEHGNESSWFRNLSDRRRQERKAKWGWWILMAGIVIEIGDASWTAIELLEMRQLAMKNDPLNQPIASVRANAVIIVRGTNWWNSIDPVKNNSFVTLLIGNRDWVQKNNAMKLHLVCRYSETYWNSDSTEWVLEFGPLPMPSPFGAAWNLTQSDTVRSADEWDFVLLQATFLHNNSEIIKGALTVTINTTVKHFPIPPQTAVQQFGRYSDMKIIGSTVSNGVNVIVKPGL